MDSERIEKRSLVRPDLTPDEYAKWVKKKKAMEYLLSFPRLPAEYADPNYDPDYKLLREAAYRERGLIP